ncbi:MAG: histidine kinase [Flavisolibacter sp.]|nr:histidine kinase [Flavisolibacter sp.]
MNWYRFIFSERKSDRLQRHFIFWLLWGLYFSLSYFHYQQTGVEKVEFEMWNLPFFIKSLALLSIHASACYFFIGYLMPHYLFEAKYYALIPIILLLSLLIVIVNYSLHKSIFPLVDSAFNHQPIIISQNIWWTSITSGLLSAPKIICAAAAVKLLKRWWLKEKEKEKIEKEKLLTDLQLLKAQIHPEFLFSSLNNISLLTKRKSVDKASASLLKLADILSYMLYESENTLVALDKELKAIKDYLLLQKTKMGDRLEIDIAIRGDCNKIFIVPLLLFPFVENSFSYFGNNKLERIWINLQFFIENSELTMKLINGKTEEPSLKTSDVSSLAKAMKQLDFFYPGQYDLKTTIEPEIMVTTLKIKLQETMETANNIYLIKKELYAPI